MSNVSYKLQDDIATITMDDGKANAMNPEMIGAVNAALDQVEKEAKVVILAGRPGVFCGGFDLKVIRGDDDERRRAQSLGGARLAMRLFGFPKPTLMAATGSGVALGGFLLLAGDYRIGISGDFTIGLNEVAIGMSLPSFALTLVDSRIDKRHVTNAAISSTMYCPEDAIAPGFLDEVVPLEELMGRAMEKAKQLAQLDGDSFAKVKREIRGESIQAILDELQNDVLLN